MDFDGGGKVCFDLLYRQKKLVCCYPGLILTSFYDRFQKKFNTLSPISKIIAISKDRLVIEVFLKGISVGLYFHLAFLPEDVQVSVCKYSGSLDATEHLFTISQTKKAFETFASPFVISSSWLTRYRT